MIGQITYGTQQARGGWNGLMQTLQVLGLGTVGVSCKNHI